MSGEGIIPSAPPSAWGAPMAPPMPAPVPGTAAALKKALDTLELARADSAVATANEREASRTKAARAKDLEEALKAFDEQIAAFRNMGMPE